VVHLLHVYPSRRSDLVEPERLSITPALGVEEYYDGFANHRTRICAPAGTFCFFSEATIHDSGELDAYQPQAAQLDVSEIPMPVMKFLSPSRYCEVDSELMDFAWRTLSQRRPGWERIQAICDFVHEHLRFDYQQARFNRTALEAFRERVGVCRDFAHLAITLGRYLNIPARYATGYLGDRSASFS
jgi:transglutaminase-like putative cysteine protease